jgi:hypothetical protein
MLWRKIIKEFFGFMLSPLPFALSLVGAVLLALCSSAQAQQTRSVPLIGFLTTGSAGGSARNVEALRQSLRELGYVEGKTSIS